MSTRKSFYNLRNRVKNLLKENKEADFKLAEMHRENERLKVSLEIRTAKCMQLADVCSLLLAAEIHLEEVKIKVDDLIK